MAQRGVPCCVVWDKDYGVAVWGSCRCWVWLGTDWWERSDCVVHPLFWVDVTYLFLFLLCPIKVPLSHPLFSGSLPIPVGM